MTRVFFSLFFILLVHCTTASRQLEERLELGEPVSQVFLASVDDVSLAVRMALVDYPQQRDDPEAGVFETAYIRSSQFWKPPHLEHDPYVGHRYRLRVRIIEGRVRRGESAVRVEITKDIERPGSFFDSAVKVPSDGLEEKALLYRIGRELRIAHELEQE